MDLLSFAVCGTLFAMCDWGQRSPAMGIKETNFLGFSHLYPIFCENKKTSFLSAFNVLESLLKKKPLRLPCLMPRTTLAESFMLHDCTWSQHWSFLSQGKIKLLIIRLNIDWLKVCSLICCSPMVSFVKILVVKYFFHPPWRP